MSRIILILSFILLCISSIFAVDNFEKATIHKLNGEKMPCYIKTPLKNFPKKFVIKTNLNGSKQNLKTDDIDFLTLTKANKKHLFKLSEFYTVSKKGSIKTKSRVLLLLEVRCPNYDTFLNATEYKFKKNGDVVLVRSGYAFRYYFIQKKNNDFPMDLSFFLTYQKSKIPFKRKEELLDLVKGDKSFTNFVMKNNVITVEILDAYFDSICE